MAQREVVGGVDPGVEKWEGDGWRCGRGREGDAAINSHSGRYEQRAAWHQHITSARDVRGLVFILAATAVHLQQ